MKRDQHADTLEDEEAYVKILREVGPVEELDGRWRMGDIETLGSNKRCTDAETRSRVLDVLRDENPGIPGGSATTRRDGSRPGHTRIPEKEMRVRFGGKGDEGKVGNSDEDGDTCDGGWESSELDGGGKIGRWRDRGSYGSDEKRKR